MKLHRTSQVSGGMLYLRLIRLYKHLMSCERENAASAIMVLRGIITQRWVWAVLKGLVLLFCAEDLCTIVPNAPPFLALTPLAQLLVMGTCDVALLRSPRPALTPRARAGAPISESAAHRVITLHRDIGLRDSDDTALKVAVVLAVRVLVKDALHQPFAIDLTPRAKISITINTFCWEIDDGSTAST
jgi:hypothetical protein